MFDFYNGPNLFYEVLQKNGSQKGEMEELGDLSKERCPAQSGMCMHGVVMACRAGYRGCHC